ncbi:N-acetyl sugar amidotransferase [Neorhodopirellula pilleata]|uniref:N-acetyl sugar amidotransferase n=1 Tax=Neorhodopirellula pilleata TaxID=2714738 RepID=A0A5C6ADD3_9BACT|nr:N-acetyl sugar amidotransferase [Neorhodopirellula pilleata]TWT96263.1 hypothetical protein Pla100_27400 [Neorhodopirellula pilleata]
MSTATTFSEDRVATTQCTRCVLTDEDIPDFQVDEAGVCSTCIGFAERWGRHLKTRESREAKLEEAIRMVKEAGRDSRYDCVIGISGGVDSTYLAWKINQLGLRPIAVHFDNGWNSELAVQNIQSLTSKLKIDLMTFVVDWPEFRDLQRAYFRASVVDIEVPTDHGIYGTLFQTAVRHNVRYVLGGNNIATEGFMPNGWHYQKCDHINLLDIHRKFGTQPLKTYPLFDCRMKKSVAKRGVELLEILDLIEYSREEAVSVISGELNWRDYGVKHGESTFTKFYQGFVLPRKFGIDKRKAHLSTLIGTGELTREGALEILAKPVYSPSELRVEREYVLKKLGFTDAEFDTIMATPPRPHRDYETEGSLFYEHRWLLPARPIWEKTRDLLGLRRRPRPNHFEIR